jgi:type I restriction enzyme S subunit
VNDVVRRLDAVCSITMGQAPPGDTYNTVGEGLPLIAGAGDFDGDRPEVKKFTSSASKVCTAGDIVLGIRASIGAKVWADRRYCLGRGVAGLRPGPELDARYLWHWLGHSATALAAKGRGATFLQVNRNDIGEMPIVLPSMEEQRRIAAILDQADALRAKRMRSRNLFANIEASIFEEMFGRGDFPLFQLRDLVDVDDRINYGVVQPGDHVAGGVPLIRVSDLNGRRVSRSQLKRISPQIEAKYARSRVRGTEILLSCVGSIGLVALTCPNDIGANVARAVTRIPISDPAMRMYVAAVLSSSRVQRYFVTELRTVSQPTLNGKQIGETLVHVPPESMVHEFADRMQQLEVKGKALRASDSEFATLQRSLAASAFGEALP